MHIEGEWGGGAAEHLECSTCMITEEVEVSNQT
jgi:hypothetical protein